MYFSIITTQILILAFLAFIGVIATKVNVITEQVKNSIASIVFNITLPALIISSVSSVNLNEEILTNSIWVFIFSITGIVLLYFTGKLSKILIKLKGSKGNVHVIHTMLGNTVFLGYPLFTALFPGGEGLFYAIIFHLTQNIFIWTIGVYEFNNTKDLKFKDSIKHLINPNTISFFIGLLMLIFKLKFPDFLFNPINGLGKATIYLAMLYIGAVLVQNPMLVAFKKPEIYILSLNKLLIVPFILLMLINLITNLFQIHIGDMAKTVVVMQTAMPCMALVVVLAKKFGSDDIHATENLFMTTILSLASLPLIYFLTQILQFR